MKSSTRAARVYASIRTAHLERLDSMMPAVLIYQRQRYDFDVRAAPDGAELLQLGRLATVLHLLRRHYAVVEVNEPTWSTRWLDLGAQVLAVKVRAFVSRKPTVITSYCIGNLDPVESIRQRRPQLPRWTVSAWTKIVVYLLSRAISRLAFGTSGARAAYQPYIGQRYVASRCRTFEALPAPCACLRARGLIETDDDEPPLRVVFLGAFSDRKGIRQLLTAWDGLAADCAIRLRLIGKGALTEHVVRWAAEHPRVELLIDPPRSMIHESLREAQTVVLLSQPTAGWREQVGLPIVEGLSHGCRIVTSTETGLAPWLSRNGHCVVDPGMPVDELTKLLAALVGESWSRTGALSKLPQIDRRAAADRWMFGDQRLIQTGP